MCCMDLVHLLWIIIACHFIIGTFHSGLIHPDFNAGSASVELYFCACSQAASYSYGVVFAKLSAFPNTPHLWLA